MGGVIRTLDDYHCPVCKTTLVRDSMDIWCPTCEDSVVKDGENWREFDRTFKVLVTFLDRKDNRYAVVQHRSSPPRLISVGKMLMTWFPDPSSQSNKSN